MLLLSDMHKSAGFRQGAKMFGRSFLDTIKDYGKSIKNDIQRPLAMFSRDPGKYDKLLQEDEAINAAIGGSPIRNLFRNKASLATSAPRYDALAAMSADKRNALIDKGNSFFRRFHYDPNERWLNKLTADERQMLRTNLAQQTDVGKINPKLRRNFHKKLFKNDFTGDQFSEYYKRYGMPMENAMVQNAGRRAAMGTGALGLMTAGHVPFTGAEWIGGLTAAPGAAGMARRGAMEGVADQLHNFNNAGFLERIMASTDPNYFARRLYEGGEINRGGIAHHYMYGPGKYEDVGGGGISPFLAQLLFPMFSGNALDSAVQSRALNSFQKMGSHNQNKSMTNTDLLVKSAMFRSLARSVGRKALGGGKNIAQEVMGAGRTAAPFVRHSAKNIGQAASAAAPHMMGAGRKMMTAGRLAMPHIGKGFRSIADAGRAAMAPGGFNSTMGAIMPHLGRSMQSFAQAGRSAMPALNRAGQFMSNAGNAASPYINRSAQSLLGGGMYALPHLSRGLNTIGSTARSMVPELAQMGGIARKHINDNAVGYAGAAAGGLGGASLYNNMFKQGNALTATASAAAKGLGSKLRGWFDRLALKDRGKGLHANFKKDKWGASLTGIGLLGIPTAFLGGRSSVRDGAYNAGYGGGQAFAAQQFAQMPIWQRMGAAIMPDMATNKLLSQNQELADIYNILDQKNLPPSMRR